IWLTRSQVLAVRERAFVEAARCGGNSELRIAFRHVLPNAFAAPLTQLSVVPGFSVLLTAGLRFIRAGVAPPPPEWGSMVSEGHSRAHAPLLAIRDLRVDFYGESGTTHALDGTTLNVDSGESVGVVGTTGSGKSILARAVMGLIQPPGSIAGGSIRYAGRE